MPNPLSIFCHPFSKSLVSLSSQWSFNCQVFSMTLLAGSRTGPIKPSGSNVDLSVDKHPRLVPSLTYFGQSDTLIARLSDSVSHCSPSVLSMGRFPNPDPLQFYPQLVWQLKRPCHWRQTWSVESSLCVVTASTTETILWLVQ